MEVSRRGKALRLKAPGWKNVARMDSLGDGYDEPELRAVLSGEKEHTPRKKPERPAPEPPRVNLLVDIQAKLKAGKGAGYERWARSFNLKQMAQTLNFLTEHGLLEYGKLKEKTAAATARYNELSGQIKTAEQRLAEIAVLKPTSSITPRPVKSMPHTGRPVTPRSSLPSMNPRFCCTRRRRKPLMIWA